MTTRARRFSYAVSLDSDWVASSDRGGSRIANEEEAWTPEHFVLTGLIRCTLTSFRYHARRAGHEPVTSGSVSGVVTRREEDGRFAMVEAHLDIDVAFDPLPPPEEVRDLVAKGERDCFVGASLTVKPDCHWTVNGEELP